MILDLPYFLFLDAMLYNLLSKKLSQKYYVVSLNIATYFKKIRVTFLNLSFRKSYYIIYIKIKYTKIRFLTEKIDFCVLLTKNLAKIL